MDALKLTAMSEGSSVGDVSFVEDAVRTLVEARHALAASYGYGYSILIVPVRERFEKQQVRERERERERVYNMHNTYAHVAISPCLGHCK